MLQEKGRLEQKNNNIPNITSSFCKRISLLFRVSTLHFPPRTLPLKYSPMINQYDLIFSGALLRYFIPIEVRLLLLFCFTSESSKESVNIFFTNNSTLFHVQPGKEILRSWCIHCLLGLFFLFFVFCFLFLFLFLFLFFF